MNDCALIWFTQYTLAVKVVRDDEQEYFFSDGYNHIPNPASGTYRLYAQCNDSGQWTQLDQIQYEQKDYLLCVCPGCPPGTTFYSLSMEIPSPVPGWLSSGAIEMLTGTFVLTLGEIGFQYSGFVSDFIELPDNSVTSNCLSPGSDEKRYARFAFITNLCQNRLCVYLGDSSVLNTVAFGRLAAYVSAELPPLCIPMQGTARSKLFFRDSSNQPCWNVFFGGAFGYSFNYTLIPEPYL
jgi:hypothetical protein